MIINDIGYLRTQSKISLVRNQAGSLTCFCLALPPTDMRIAPLSPRWHQINPKSLDKVSAQMQEAISATRVENPCAIEVKSNTSAREMAERAWVTCSKKWQSRRPWSVVGLIVISRTLLSSSSSARLLSLMANEPTIDNQGQSSRSKCVGIEIELVTQCSELL
jgi:hypothetical protein